MRRPLGWRPSGGREASQQPCDVLKPRRVSRSASETADLVPAGYSVSGLFDLKPLVATAMNADLKLNEPAAAQVSPLWWPVPRGRVFDAVVGGSESPEFLRQSKAVADDWRQRGIETRYEAVPGANHFTVLDPLSQAGSAMTARCVALAARCAKVDK